MVDKILEIDNLSVEFNTDDGIFYAVDDVSFNINKGEVLGLVGESGCGKSVTGMSIPGLIPSPPGFIKKGKIIFKGNDLLRLNPRKMRNIRGSQISMIFQEPASALSPLHRIGTQMAEAVLLHDKNMSKKKAFDLSKLWLNKVGIPDIENKILAYPHQLSGGMRQRVMIAMALMMNPDLIIADEPTTALDVTTQKQIFELIKTMKHTDMSILLITHDMGVIWEMCDRVIVMYASKIVEQGTLNQIFLTPIHPYTKGLLESIPELHTQKKRFKAIPGQVPTPLSYPRGCHFNNRCSRTDKKCYKEKPELKEIENGHTVACFNPLIDQKS